MTAIECRCRVDFPGGFAVDVDFKTGSPVVALFGPSGSGKTTVLDAIAGLRKPSSARIVLGERVLADTARRIHLPPEQRRIGYVFQDLRLFPHLSVASNLKFALRGRTPATLFDRVARVLELAPLLERKPGHLSGGERQRVALGRALLSAPELLLFDESLASLDERLKLQALTHIERVIGEWGIPTIYVSHSQAEVRRLAHWVVVLQNGRVAAEGTPGDALAAPLSLSLTEEAAPMNLLKIEALRAEGTQRMARIGGQWLTLPAPAAGAFDPRFIAFPPGAVMLAPHDIEGVSARNHLRARVVRTVEMAGAVFVELDAGQMLWALITPQAARELRVEPGQSLLCLLKTQGLTIS